MYYEDESPRGSDGIRYVDEPDARLLAHVKASLAEYERTRILERTMAGRRARWLKKNPGPALISRDEGFALGQTMNRVRFPAVAQIAATLVAA